MSKKALTFKGAQGGMATDLKMGIKGSFAAGQALNFRPSPSQITVLPRTRQEDGGVFKSLPQNEVMVDDGSIYALAASGGFYRRSTAGSWSFIADGDTAGAYGMNYRKDTNAIYVAGTKSVSAYTNLNTVPVYQPGLYGTSFSTYDNTKNAGFNVSSYQINGTALYTLQTTYDENGKASRFFQTDIEPLITIQVFVVTKGTGDYTLTLHDGLNNSLGTVTILNANIVANDWNSFTFSTQVRLYVKPNARTYHFHLTSTVADGIIYATDTADFGSINVRIFADRLVITNNGMHPIERFLQYECIGNGNYLSIWEPLSTPPTNDEWLRHKLVFPEEYEVCGLAVFNEYLAIAVERTTTGVNTPQDGIIFYWDGLSTTYNYSTPIPEGSPYALSTYKNAMYYVAGSDWYGIGTVAATPVKLRHLPGGDNEFNGTTNKSVVYPYGATVRNGIHLLAWPGTTTNKILPYGVYSWGQTDKNFANSFGYNYTISTGSQFVTDTNGLKIGMVKAYGDILHIGWQDNGAYGIDIVDNSSAPAAFAYWESLIFDGGYIGKDKLGHYVDATFLPLPAGGTLRLKYSLNRGAWVYSEYFSATNLWFNHTGYARLIIGGGTERFNEAQVGFEIVTTTATTSPTVTSVNMIIDPLDGEQLQ